MKRKLSRNKYIIAGIITFIVFVLGVFAGLFIESQRLGFTTKTLTQQKVDTGSLQLQYVYLNTLNLEENCGAVKKIFDDNLKTLDQSMKRVQTYTEGSTVDEEEFKLLSREFVLEQIKYWLLANQVKETCGFDIISVLSFFNKNCDNCETQTFILEYLKKVFGEKFLLFHFNVEIEEPMISTLLIQYNITTYPTIIIEGKKFEGLIGRDNLTEIVCDMYKEKPEECS